MGEPSCRNPRQTSWRPDRCAACAAHLGFRFQCLGFKFLDRPPCAPLLLLGHAVLVITARNWLYLVTVGYKISRRLALLAPAPLPARLSGAVLTFVGVFLGLWQSVAYTAFDAAFEIVLSKAAVFGLSQCSLVAVVLWQLWSAFVQFRTSTKAWQLGRLAIKEARLLVMAPHALLANNQALVSHSGLNVQGLWCAAVRGPRGPVVRVQDGTWLLCSCAFNFGHDWHVATPMLGRLRRAFVLRLSPSSCRRRL